MSPYIPQLEYARRLLNGAIYQRVVDAALFQLADPVVERAMKRAGAHEDERGKPETYQLLETPKTLRWREQVFVPTVHNPQNEYVIAELARIAVPQGSVGHLQGIDQVLYDVDGNYFPTNSEYWGSPYFAFDEVDDCKWWLTLSNFYGGWPARFFDNRTTAFDITDCPGYPYSELHEIRGLWYPAGNKERVKMVIPGAKMLRFFVQVPPQTVYNWKMAGRLRASLQSTYHDVSAFNASRL
jgi:hypothetical protein